ncbi:hypothetical protein K5549_016086, partial [Capra hircus]
PRWPPQGSPGRCHNNVLTPDKIPDFFIPPKLPAGPAEPEAQAELGPSTSEQNLASAAPRRAPRSPRLSVAESPHTRRKESLFHSEHGALAQGAPREAGGTLMSPGRCVSGGESDTGSSAESSPFGSPLLSRSVSLLKGFAQDSQAKVSQLKHSVGRHGSLSADDSTPDTSPGARRRLPRRATPEPGPESGPASRAEHAVRMGPRGKLQKQRSTIVKNSRHPVFNEDFFFDGLGPASVRKLALRIKVVNKGSSLKRDTLLGEKELPLTSLLPFLETPPPPGSCRGPRPLPD